MYAILDSRCYIMHFRSVFSKVVHLYEVLHCGCIASISVKFACVEHSLSDSAQQTVAIILGDKALVYLIK